MGLPWTRCGEGIYSSPRPQLHLTLDFFTNPYWKVNSNPVKYYSILYPLKVGDFLMCAAGEECSQILEVFGNELITNIPDIQNVLTYVKSKFPFSSFLMFSWEYRKGALIWNGLTLFTQCISESYRKTKINLPILFLHFFVVPQKILWRPLRLSQNLLNHHREVWK